MAKTLLPFALYEELEKIESLSPTEMKSFLASLQKYCESTGKDFSKVCSDIGLETPSWAGKLTYRQNELLGGMIRGDNSNENRREISWEINPETGRLDVTGKIEISSWRKEEWEELIKSGVKIGVLKGSFEAPDCGFESSEGFPTEVTGNFVIRGNKLSNLIGCPTKVGGKYDCRESLLTSLEGSPEIADTFDCSTNKGLRNLKGGPKQVNQYYYASNCELDSLEGFPISVDKNSYFYLDGNKLYSLEGIPLDPPVNPYRVKCSKNLLKSEVLLNAYKEAARTGSWIVGYLSMFTDPEFIKTGKAPKDPIREKLSPANLKKEIETNGEAFVVGLKSIWKDFRVQKILKGIEIPTDTKADAELLADLDDVGL
jgi:hypothetical protein